MDNISKSSSFFLDDEPVILLVEDCLFKVNRHLLRRDSEIFNDMFSLPSGDNPEGASEEHPIVVPGVTTLEMESLLKFFYFGMYESSIQGGGAELTALLSISTRFFFEKIREMVIKEIDKDISYTLISPVDRIVLAEKYDVSKWRRPAYVELALRTLPPNLEEGEKIGWDLATKICQARESLRDERCDRFFTPEELYHRCTSCSVKIHGSSISNISYANTFNCTSCRRSLSNITLARSLPPQADYEKRECLTRIMSGIFGDDDTEQELPPPIIYYAGSVGVLRSVT